jgi:hypothetical protein
MTILKPLLSIVGIIAVLVGLLWIGQGTGYVRFIPSPMIDDATWTTRGAILAVVGIGMIWIGRRISR